MTSQPKGNLLVPVWVDSGVVKALVNDAGEIPVTEQTPLTNIQARLYGYDGENWLPLRTDEDKNIFAVIAGQEYDLAVGCADADDLFTGEHGYDGTDWQKQGLIWSFNSSYGESVSDDTMPAGLSDLVGTAVPAGEVWVITGISSFVVSGTCTQMAILANIDGVDVFCNNQINPVSGQVYPFVVDLRLQEGDQVLMRYYTMTLNDDAYLYFWGYKMKVTM